MPGGLTVEVLPMGGLCVECGTPIVKLAHGGGEVFVCPTCQPENRPER